jgi:hypothetical protein
MNKKNPEQISSGSFNYLLNLGRITSEAKQSLPTSPSNLKVVGALDNYSLVFVILRTTKRLSRTSTFFS